MKKTSVAVWKYQSFTASSATIFFFSRLLFGLNPEHDIRGTFGPTRYPNILEYNMIVVVVVVVVDVINARAFVTFLLRSVCDCYNLCCRFLFSVYGRNAARLIAFFYFAGTLYFIRFIFVFFFFFFSESQLNATVSQVIKQNRYYTALSV